MRNANPALIRGKAAVARQIPRPSGAQTTSAAELRRREAGLDNKMLETWQQQALKKCTEQFQKSIEDAAKIHWLARGFVGAALFDVTFSYFVLSVAANQKLFTGDVGGSAPMVVIGSLIVLNSVGLNTYLNFDVFTARIRQIQAAVTAAYHRDFSLLNNYARLVFDFLRLGFGILASMVYAQPFSISVYDGSRIHTRNEDFNKVASGFFTGISYFAIAIRGLLILNSVEKLTGILPIKTRSTGVVGVQAEIAARLTNFKESLHKKLNSEAPDNVGTWKLLQTMNRQMQAIDDAKAEIAKLKATRRQPVLRSEYQPLAGGDNPGVAESEANTETGINAAHKKLYNAWQELGKTLLEHGQGGGSVSLPPVVVPMSNSVWRELNKSVNQWWSWVPTNRCLMAYRLLTYLLSLLIAGGYVYAQLDKTKQGAVQMFGVTDGSAAQAGLVYPALVAAALFGAHWTYQAFEKLAELYTADKKRHALFTLIAVLTTAAPAIAIGGSDDDNNKTPLLLLIVSGVAGATMNYVGQYNILRKLFIRKKSHATTSEEAMSELHAVQSNLLLKLFNGLIGELEAQLNNDYAISSKNILALGRVWGIVREACDVKDDFRLQDSKKTCQNMRSCCVKANHGYANNMSVNGPGSESVAITSSRRGSTTSAVAASYGSNLDALGQQEAQTLLIARYLPALPPQLSNLTKMVSEVFSNPSHRTPVQQSRSISAVASPPSMALSAAGTGLEMKDVPLSTPTAMSLSITVSSPHATVSVAGTPHQAPIEAFASIVNQLDRPQMAQAFSIFQQRSRALALPEEIVSGAAAV